MTPRSPSINPSPWQPLSQPLSDIELEGLLGEIEPTQWGKESSFDTNTDYQFPFPSDTSDLEWSQWTNYESHLTQTVNAQPGHQDHEELKASEIVYDSAPSLARESVGPSSQRSLTNVSQWLDGAYRPPVSCAHCRRHRLQCLIIRTAPANPNPKNSCSSCVALFRECSLAKGEKRQPSGFETFSPVFGHLHGVPEDGNPFPATTMDNGHQQKEPKQFLRKGARVLREWFYQNQEYPYPTDEQKNQMAHETGFSQKRISTWFANARRRQKQKIQAAGLASTSRTRSGSPMVTSTLSSLTPMERWRASPPEDEPIPEAAIQNAISSGSIDSADSIDPLQLDISTMDFFNFDESSSHLASSVSSIGSKVSETSDSASSAWSYHSSADTGLPFPLLPKQTKLRRTRGRQRTAVDHPFQCTFCPQSFKKKHDWARHEKSVHFTLDSWVCTPNPHDVQQAFERQFSECPFCDVLFPTFAHWEEHEFQVCADKPTQERSFSRKDYLWQHLRKFHGCTKAPVADLEAWRGSTANVESRCGFCGSSLSTWSDRAEHLAGHFKKGARMDQWEGDWGLDASALRVLRNAVPPSQRALNMSA
ncbi:transcriptional regulator family: Homeodomain [Penicillium roqueforti]|uniref:transcriptional regulator family: Homeodomain n=1 Tax=Penicillium roqueforti TaxID=5082 RepID=UPI00190D5F17|nr:transcriptional regulator family: Homeodomain [Penicillium roqueforti]KAF9250227.1 transcriptional regulator family: Homeodomain [Penicillium roqueforti]KAI2717183.1 transcriptional regulator family: Homeodomain [Penicillium roqueforti]KAI2727246.1 transcriptional regulator family: Homeodomain [Penicillium roqueforti]KAI3112730.1 transcriptional regulator family: Homeodomain [Penicillium roqueforti]KAI3129768.1 transcriptional regulator family: Homeodomain [Penicillium roqueforti]